MGKEIIEGEPGELALSVVIVAPEGVWAVAMG